MTASPFVVPVTLEIQVQASSLSTAKEKVGQIVELLPVRMESVLSRLRFTRHDVAVEYHRMAVIAAAAAAAASPSQTTFKVPLQVVMEMEATSPEDACAKAETVLSQVPARMEPVFSKYNVAGVHVAYFGEPVPRVSPPTPSAHNLPESKIEIDENAA